MLRKETDWRGQLSRYQSHVSSYEYMVSSAGQPRLLRRTGREGDVFLVCMLHTDFLAAVLWITPSKALDKSDEGRTVYQPS